MTIGNRENDSTAQFHNLSRGTMMSWAEASAQSRAKSNVPLQSASSEQLFDVIETRRKEGVFALKKRQISLNEPNLE